MYYFEHSFYIIVFLRIARPRPEEDDSKAKLVKKFYCTKCGQFFDDFRKMHNHMFQSVKKHVFWCACCKCIVGSTLLDVVLHTKKFCSRDEFRRAEEEEAKSKPNQNRYFCERCGHGFEMLSGLLLHQTEHKNQQVCCSMCDRKASNLLELLIHSRDHMVVGNIELPCKLCPLKFYASTPLKLHYYTLHKRLFDIPYECAFCFVEFVDDEDGFLRHVQSHCMLSIEKASDRPQSDVSKTTCEYCASIFDKATVLNDHRTSVHKVKPDEKRHCPECKQDILMTALSNHVLRHLRQKASKMPKNEHPYMKKLAIRKKVKVPSNGIAEAVGTNKSAAGDSKPKDAAAPVAPRSTKSVQGRPGSSAISSTASKPSGGLEQKFLVRQKKSISSQPVEAAIDAEMVQSNVGDSQELDEPPISSAKKLKHSIEVKSNIRKFAQVDQQIYPVDKIILEEKPKATSVSIKTPGLDKDVAAKVKKDITGITTEPAQASSKQVEVSSIGEVDKPCSGDHDNTISSRLKEQSSVSTRIKKFHQEDGHVSLKDETKLNEKPEAPLNSGKFPRLDTFSVTARVKEHHLKGSSEGPDQTRENKSVSGKAVEASKVVEVPSQPIGKLPKHADMFTGPTNAAGEAQTSSTPIIAKVTKLAVEVPFLASDSIESEKVDPKPLGSEPVGASIPSSQPKSPSSLPVSADGSTGKSVSHSSPMPSNAEGSQTLAFVGTPHLKALYCHKCGLLFDDFDSLHQHIFQSSDPRHSFRCAHCNFIVGKSLVNLLDHMKKYCSIGQISQVEREQVSEPSSGNNYFCELCGKGVKFLSDLLGHYAEHKASWLCCSSCEEKCSNFQDLVFHYRQHVVFGNIMLRCHICKMKFFSAVTYKRHYSVVHRMHEYVPFECEWCDDVIVDDEYKFMFHVQSHCIKGPQTGRRNVDVTELTCEECSQIFPNSNKCRVHKEVFHRLTRAKIVKCSSCRKRKMYGEMEDHMDAHQKVKAAKLNALSESTVVPKIRRKRNRSKKAAKNLKIRREARKRVKPQRQKRASKRMQQQINKSLWNMTTWNNQPQAQHGWQPPYQHPTQMPNMVPQPYPPTFSAQPFYPPPHVPPFIPSMPQINLVPNSPLPFTSQPPPNLVQVPVVTEVVREAAPVVYSKASPNPVTTLTTTSTSKSESGSFVNPITKNVAQTPKPPKVETSLPTDVVRESAPVVYRDSSPRPVASPISKSAPLSISSPKIVAQTPKPPMTETPILTHVVRESAPVVYLDGSLKPVASPTSKIVPLSSSSPKNVAPSSKVLKPPKIIFNLLPPKKTEPKKVAQTPKPPKIETPIPTHAIREPAPVVYLDASPKPVVGPISKSAPLSISCPKNVAQTPKPHKMETALPTDVRESPLVVYLDSSPEPVSSPISKSPPLSISSPKIVAQTPKPPKVETPILTDVVQESAPVVYLDGSAKVLNQPKIIFNLLPPKKTEPKNVTRYNVQSSKLFLEWCSKDDEETSVTVKTSQWNADKAKDIASSFKTGDQVLTSSTSNWEGGIGYEKCTSTSNSKIEWEVKRITESSNPDNPFEDVSSDSSSEREESFLDNLPIESFTDPSELPPLFPISASKSTDRSIIQESRSCKRIRDDNSSRDKQAVARSSWTTSQVSSIDRKEKGLSFLERERNRNLSKSAHMDDDRGRVNKR